MQSTSDEIVSNQFCKVCGVKFPKMSRRNFESYVCVCERNMTNPHKYPRDLIDAGVKFCCITGERKN